MENSDLIADEEVSTKDIENDDFMVNKKPNNEININENVLEDIGNDKETLEDSVDIFTPEIDTNLAVRDTEMEVSSEINQESSVTIGLEKVVVKESFPKGIIPANDNLFTFEEKLNNWTATDSDSDSSDIGISKKRMKFKNTLCDDEDSNNDKLERPVGHNLQSFCDPESEEENEQDIDKNDEEDFNNEEPGKLIEHNLKSLCDPESEEENEHDSDNDNKNEDKNEKNSKKFKTSKVTQKELLRYKEHVHSMVQKNAREAIIDIPYHKPEQYQLKDFLARLQTAKKQLPIEEKLTLKTCKFLKLEKSLKLEEEQKSKENCLIEKVDSSDANNEENGGTIVTDELDRLVSHTSENIEKIAAKIDAEKEETGIKRLTLQGSPNSIIDLDNFSVELKDIKQKSVVDKLIESCMVKNLKIKTNQSLVKPEPIPGAPYKVLKETLGQELLRKRKEQIMKKLEEEKECKKKDEELNKFYDDEEEEDFDDYEDDEDDEDDEDKEKIDDNDKNFDEIEAEAISESDEEKVENEQIEDNNVEEDDDDFDVDDRNEKDNDGVEIQESNKQRQRIIDEWDDSDDDNDIDFNKSLELQSLTDCPNTPIMKSLTSNDIDIPDLNTSLNASQIEVDEVELMDLCSGNFATQASQRSMQNQEENLNKEVHINTMDDLNSSNDGELNPGNEDRKKKSKKMRIYVQSDDEDESSVVSSHDLLEENDNDEEELQAEPTEADYDSEENEIEQKQRNEPAIKVSDYFENEAELSESEWGSEDEDERDLDKLDIELADEEQFDQDKLQLELERIHMRRLLDQDSKEIKKIQELLLQDEEQDGVGRQRTFKWLNNETSFNDPTNPDFDPNKTAGNCDGSDDENEELWRRIRHEREDLLKEKGNSLPTDILDVELIENKTPNSSVKKISIVKHSGGLEPKHRTNLSFLLPVESKKMMAQNKSLLLKDNATLSRLAILSTKTVEATATVGVEARKEFVFRNIQETDTMGKRKSTEILTLKNQIKRQKNS